MNMGTISAFAIYLIGMLAIGFWCWKMTSNLSDYIQCERLLPPEQMKARLGPAALASK